MARETDRQTNRQTNKQTDRQIERKTERKTHTQREKETYLHCKGNFSLLSLSCFAVLSLKLCRKLVKRNFELFESGDCILFLLVVE